MPSSASGRSVPLIGGGTSAAVARSPETLDVMTAIPWRVVVLVELDDSAAPVDACPDLTDLDALGESLRDVKASFSTDHPRL
jgi:hypothetical protein